MKSLSPALAQHMAGPVTTLRHLIKVTRQDGVIYAVTDHDDDISYGGTTYLCATGFDTSTMQTSATLSVDNYEASGFLAAIGVSEASIISGVWDFAEVRVLRVNWADLSMGDEKLPRGWIGELTIERGKFRGQIQSLAQKLQSHIGELVTESCKANLFDSRCKIVPTEGVWKFSGVAVSAIVSPQRRFIAGALTQAADFFTSGHVTWVTGANAGLSMEIKAHMVAGELLLQETTPYAISPLDTFIAFAGCTKRYTEDCLTRFANAPNFRGFPFLSGSDAMLRGPK